MLLGWIWTAGLIVNWVTDLQIQPMGLLAAAARTANPIGLMLLLSFQFLKTVKHANLWQDTVKWQP